MLRKANEVIWWPFWGDKEEGGIVIVLILVLVNILPFFASKSLSSWPGEPNAANGVEVML